MSGYTYDVRDIYNCFGAGHNYRVRLYLNGRSVGTWDYDSIFGIGGALVRHRIRKLESIYGARRV